MVSAIAAQRQRTDPRQCLIVDKKGRGRWSEVWDHNPRIARPDNAASDLSRYQIIANGPGLRPYVDTHNKTQWFYTDWSVSEPGEIYLTDEERQAGEALARPYAVIEPHVKTVASQNKRWRFGGYEEVVRMLPQIPWVQFDYGGPILRGVRAIRTRTFRQGCGVLAGARLYLGGEGGLHHAAAALRTRAVVLFMGMVSPQHTGYSSHVNIVYEHPMTPCGMRVHCDHCDAARQAITPEQVAAAVAQEWSRD